MRHNEIVHSGITDQEHTKGKIAWVRNENTNHTGIREKLIVYIDDNPSPIDDKDEHYFVRTFSLNDERVRFVLRRPRDLQLIDFDSLPWYKRFSLKTKIFFLPDKSKLHN